MRKVIFYGILMLIGLGIWNSVSGRRPTPNIAEAGVSSAFQTVTTSAPAPSSQKAAEPPSSSIEPIPSLVEQAKAMSHWFVTTDRSAMDDSTTVYLVVHASETIPGKFADAQRPELDIRCLEHTTALTVQFGDHFMADIDSYGTVTYRIDQQKAQKRDFRASTDGSVLGLWDGGSSISFIKSLFGADALLLRAMPFDESAYEATFPITGLQQEIAPLRKACGW